MKQGWVPGGLQQHCVFEGNGRPREGAQPSCSICQLDESGQAVQKLYADQVKVPWGTTLGVMPTMCRPCLPGRVHTLPAG